MRKNLRLLVKTALFALILMLMIGTAANAEVNAKTSSYDGVEIGTAADVVGGQVTLTGVNNSGRYIKIWVKKGIEDSIGKWYNTSYGSGINEVVPLADGAGLYDIYAMIQVNGNEYSYGPCITVKNEAREDEVPSSANQSNTKVIAESRGVKAEKTSLYTNSSKDVDSYDSEVVELSKKLTEGKKTSREKIKAICNWAIENVEYDYDKYNNILAKNFQDQYGSLVALRTKKGVCYDYSALVAALCRAVNIPSKLAKGYTTNVIGYHAWNEIYDSENDKWIIVDTTVDSVKYHKQGKSLGFTVRSEEEYYKTDEI